MTTDRLSLRHVLAVPSFSRRNSQTPITSATPELTSHRTATGKSSPSRSGTGTGTKCVANDAALNVDDDEGILKKGTAPKGTLFAYVLFIDSHLFVP